MAATDWDEATFEAHRPLLFSIAYRMLGSASEAEDVVQDAWLRVRQDEHAGVRSPRAYAGKMHWSESDFQIVTINGAPGLLMRHPLSGNGIYSFDIADGWIGAIYVVRNPDKLRGFLEHTH
jgi:hypothetical protein